MNSDEVHSLFAQTLLGDCASELAWAAVSALRMNGSRDVFEFAAEWCRADDPLKKARAADILCQLQRAQSQEIPSASQWMFRDESFELIADILENEQDPIVLHSAITALGHIENLKAVPLILRYLDHAQEEIRFAVAFALGCFANDQRAVLGLTKLTMDSCAAVRDWAVFGLGVLGDCDSPEIRDALLRCTNDTDVDVREEAAVGLGKRHDQRLIPQLHSMFDRGEVTVRVTEAAMGLLELQNAPPDWTPADYKAALHAKFNSQE
ncbi:MAG: HEAT repeat domain-containing protein [Bryobacteraceae bacterium]